MVSRKAQFQPGPWGGQGRHAAPSIKPEWPHLDIRRLGLAITICVSSLGSSQCVSGAEGIFDYPPRQLQSRQFL